MKPTGSPRMQPAEAGRGDRFQKNHQRREGGRQMPERKGEQPLAAGMADERHREERRDARRASPATSCPR